MEIFNQEEQEQVVHAISLAENRTSGEIRLVVERRVHNMDAIDQAKYYFEKLKMHETTQRNGVLIYLATDDHQFAIIGDTGINGHAMSRIIPITAATTSAKMPITITIERTIAPMTREINRSNHARSCTPIGPRTRPAEIWRNGAKSVRIKRSSEK